MRKFTVSVCGNLVFRHGCVAASTASIRRGFLNTVGSRWTDFGVSGESLCTWSAVQLFRFCRRSRCPLKEHRLEGVFQLRLRAQYYGLPDSMPALHWPAGLTAVNPVLREFEKTRSPSGKKTPRHPTPIVSSLSSRPLKGREALKPSGHRLVLSSIN